MLAIAQLGIYFLLHLPAFLQVLENHNRKQINSRSLKTTQLTVIQIYMLINI